VSVGYRVVHRSGGGLPIIKLLMTKATDGYLQLATFGHPTAVDPDFDARHCHSYVEMSGASHLFRFSAREVLAIRDVQGHRRLGVRASTNCQTAPPSDTLERQRIEQNRLLSSHDLGPGWATSFRE